MQTIRTKHLMLVAGSALMGVTISLSPGLAQDEALKTCRQDWRTSQAALRANGINQKTFIADCQAAATARAGAISTGAGSPDGRTNETAAATGATAGTKKSTRACREEWRTNQTALRANGMTEKVYVAECQGTAGNASAQSPASPDSQTKPASATLPHATAGETLKVKACVEEWRTKRRTKRGTDELQGLTEKAYTEKCLSGSTPAAPSSGAASSR
jgi:hypothetical protein